MPVMTMSVTTCSWHLYACCSNHDVVYRYQYASTGEQVKIKARIDERPYTATKAMLIQTAMIKLRLITEVVRRRKNVKMEILVNVVELMYITSMAKVICRMVISEVGVWS